jgi:acyl dehydratase
VRPGDVITAEARVTGVREDKPITTLATSITNQDGVVVLDGTAVVWRDPVVAGSTTPSTPSLT